MRNQRKTIVRLSVLAALAVAMPFGLGDEHEAGKAAAPAESPAGAGEGWRTLFDGRSLEGWKRTDFSGGGEVAVVDGHIELGFGLITGINGTRPIPKTDYEIRLEAQRVDGSDFFCGMTFPVGDSFCTWIVGGWGGALVGLSSLDGFDASENETTSYHRFENGRWYRLRLRVETGRIRAWIDDRKVVDVDTTDRRIDLRVGEIFLSKPFGIASYSTRAALRNIEYRRLNGEAAGADEAAGASKEVGPSESGGARAPGPVPANSSGGGGGQSSEFPDE